MRFFSSWPLATLLAGWLALLAPAALAQTTPAWQSALPTMQTTAAGTASARATAVDAASGAVFVTGSFTGQVAFGSTTLVSTGSFIDVFVARYEPATATWAWAKSAGGSAGVDIGTGVATDGTNVYVTGYFAGSADFFAGQTSPAPVALTGSGEEVFVAAYAAGTGTGLWANSAGGSGNDGGQGVATDGTNVYVTGYFDTSASFFAGQTSPAPVTLTGTGGSFDMFVAAYAAGTGTGLWANSAGGSSTDLGNSVATDGTNVYVTGYFNGSATFFAGQTSPAPVTLSGTLQEVFVAAYAAGTGTGQWANSAGSSGNDGGLGVATDGTNVYVTGYFDTSASFFAGQTSSAPVALTGSGQEVFVAAYAAGTGTGLWANSAGGSSTDQGKGVATDGTNVYVTGYFNGSATFFAGQTSPAPVTLSGTLQEVFVAAYAAGTGTGLWANSAGGTGTDIGNGVAVGAAGVYAVSGTGTGTATFGTTPVPRNAAALGRLNKTTGAWQGATACVTAIGTSQVKATAVDKASGAVYVTGQFTGQVAFGGTVLVSAGNNDVFVARYEPATATWAWAKSAGGGAGADIGYGVATDGTNVYVTGSFRTSATFFAGQTSPAPVALSGTSDDVFVAAYAAGTGTGQWAKSAGGGNVDVGNGVATDGTNVYVTGYFGGSATFFAGQTSPAPVALSGTGQEVFVAAYAAGTGTGQWAKSAGGSLIDRGQGVATDGTNVYVTGYFDTSATFFAGQTSPAPVALSGTGNDVFVAAYAAGTGTGQWAKSAGGGSSDIGQGVATDGTNVYVTGYFYDNATFFAGQTSPAPVALSGISDEVFVAAYAAGTGTGQWANSAGGSGGDLGQGVATDGTNVYVTGRFDTSADFFAGQTSPAPVTLTGTGNDVFVAAYAAGTGTGQWANSAGGSSSDVGQGVATDGSRLFVGGYVGLPAAFGSLTLAGTNGQVAVLAGLTLPPALASLSATSGTAGSTLGATGSALGGLTAVTFTPASGPATNAASGYTSTATTVSGITVPAGLASGAYTVTVTNANGTSNGLAFTVTTSGPPANLTVDNTNSTAAAPYPIAAGTYNSITVTSTGYATLAGAVVVNTSFGVSGSLFTACQPLTGPGTFTLEAGATLTICGAAGIATSGATGAVQVTGTRSFASDATYVYNGTAPQTTGTGLTGARELVIANAAGVSLSQPTAVANVLRLTSGTLTTGGALTLLSTATRTAYAVHAGGQTSGNVTVQRYVGGPTTDGYRHLSSPVQASPVSDLTTPGFTPVVNPAANALPYVMPPAASFPTIYGFDETRGGTTPAYAGFATGYFSPATLAAVLPPGRGWSVLMPGAKTPDFVGALTTGNVAMTLSATGTNSSPNTQKAGWGLLGNPYAQPIDWDLASVPSGMSSSISVFRTQGGDNGVYLTRANGLGNLPNGEIALGQGFFARATVNNTVFTFTNALRVEANPATVARPVVDTRPTVRLTLQATAPDAVADETVIYAETGATTGEDNRFDGLRPGRNTGTVPTLASLIDGQEAAINGLPLDAFTNGSTVVELTAALPLAGTYTLTAADVANLPAGTTVSLLDRKMNLTQPLTGGISYQFTASTVNDVIAGRFALVFNGGRVTGTADLAPLTSHLTLYPNPATGATVRVTGAATGQVINLLDATGRAVRVVTATPGGATLSVVGLPVGVYVVRTGATAQRLVVE